MTFLKNITLYLMGIALFGLLIYVASEEFNFQETPRTVIPNGKDTKVLLTSSVLESLNFEYKTTSKEFFYCLKGRIKGENILVEELVEENVIVSEYDYIIINSSKPCDFTGAIGTVHSHPNVHYCQPSKSDCYFWGQNRNRRFLIEMIICGNDDFYIFRHPYGNATSSFETIGWVEYVNT